MDFYRWLHRLDESAFLNLKIWEFSFRSLPQAYGHTFLKEIFFRYPLKTLAGLQAYRRFVLEGGSDRGVIYLFQGTESDFLKTAAEGNGRLLVAVGFCQKPMAIGNERPACPSGRANHICHYLARLNLATAEAGPLHPACRICHIRLVGSQALRAGASMHIMTSALDIAHDIFLPVLRRRRFEQALLSICPYSVQPISLPLLICGIPTLLFTYSRGACASYPQWLLADEGTKRERTFLSPATQATLLDWLERIASARMQSGHTCYQRFRSDGNIYVPM
ncbi:MAG: hypothetical protein ACE5NP_00910 [Anaerolineae bacterium]